MSDEYDSESESTFSVFWPLLILLVGLLIWFGCQVYLTNSQRSFYSAQCDAAVPVVKNAAGVQNRYLALMKDLYQTAQKDPAAAQIVRDAIQAGLIHVQQKDASDTNSTSATPPPADSSSK